MKNRALSLLLCTGVFFSVAFTIVNNRSQDQPDKKFVLAAADGGMLEVKLGQLAMKNGSNKEIKDFGKMMVVDHGKANQELMAVAKNKQIELPKALSSMKQQKLDSLSALSGNKFDMVYMNMMILSHEESVGLFETESNEGKDAAIKTWANGKVPTLKHHLEMSKTLFTSASKQ